MAQNGHRQRIARIKVRLLQVFENIVERRQANTNFFCDIRPCCLLPSILSLSWAATVGATKTILQLDQLTELRNTLGWPGLFFVTIRQQGQQRSDSSVAFRVNKCIV